MGKAELDEINGKELEFLNEIGRFLKGKIKEAGYTQVEFSKIIGVSCPTLGRWLNAERTIDLYNFYKICSFFDLDFKFGALGEFKFIPLEDKSITFSSEQIKKIKKLLQIIK